MPTTPRQSKSTRNSPRRIAAGHWTIANAGDLDKAIADYSEAIRINPQYAAAYCGRGVAYEKNKGEYDKEVTDETEAIQLDPKDALPYYNRGVAYRLKRDYDNAIADNTDAIRLNPNYAKAYYNRGVAYRQQALMPNGRRFHPG